MRHRLDPVGLHMIRRRQALGAALALGLGLGLGVSARAQQARAAVPQDVARALGPAAQLQGTARLRFLGLLIYDARLWVGDDFMAENYDARPLVLDLIYARSLKGTAIAERSLDEMRRGGQIAPTQARHWLGFMEQAFPDVEAGDRLSGAWNPQSGTTTFYLNGTQPKPFDDRAFGRSFFGIWLAPHTSQPALRLSLLGRAS